jgi:hypothetical protein
MTDKGKEWLTVYDAMLALIRKAPVADTHEQLAILLTQATEGKWKRLPQKDQEEILEHGKRMYQELIA